MNWLTLGVASLAVLLASASFYISLIQFATRHRPWVFVNSLVLLRRFIEEPGPYVAAIRVTNLGQIPAKGVVMKVVVGNSKSDAKRQKLTTRELGPIFPNQNVSNDFSLGDFSLDLEGGRYELPIDIKISYKGLRFLVWPSHYFTKQPMTAPNNGGEGVPRRGEPGDFS